MKDLKLIAKPNEFSPSVKAYETGWNSACDACAKYYGDYVKELEEILRWYIEEDEINECDPENQYWIDGKHKAMRLLGMPVEEQD